AAFLRSYQLNGGYTPGPLLLLCVLIGAAGTLLALVRRRAPAHPLALACLLFWVTGVVLLLAADITQFSWRYQLPRLVPLPPRPPPPAPLAAAAPRPGARPAVRLDGPSRSRPADAGHRRLSACLVRAVLVAWWLCWAWPIAATNVWWRRWAARRGPARRTASC